MLSIRKNGSGKEGMGVKYSGRVVPQDGQVRNALKPFQQLRLS